MDRLTLYTENISHVEKLKIKKGRSIVVYNSHAVLLLKY